MPLSEYSGSKKPEMSLEIESDKKAVSKATKFGDFAFNANLREQPDKSITIIDTEKEYKFSLEQIQIFAELNDIFEPNAVIIIGEFLGYDFA